MKGVFVATCVFCHVVMAAAQDVPLEYRVKAAYLYNFTKFVDWPATAFEGSDAFTICVAETNPFGPVLAATLSGDTAAGRRLVARVLRDARAKCHVLFIPASVRATPYLRGVRGAPVLTVGESPDFLEQGGIIRFVRQNGKIRFAISQDAAARSQLTISSRLLKLAIVPAGAEGGR